MLQAGVILGLVIVCCMGAFWSTPGSLQALNYSSGKRESTFSAMSTVLSTNVSDGLRFPPYTLYAYVNQMGVYQAMIANLVKHMNKHSVVKVRLSPESVSVPNDPCLSYTPLNDSTRLTSYILKNGEIEDSDAFLKTAWYKNAHRSDGELMTTCPNMTECGTSFPVWINGTLPSKGNIKSVQACKHTYRGCCGSSFSIRVKRCASFFVYELSPMTTSTGRYCFRGPRKCTATGSSATGYAPCSIPPSAMPLVCVVHVDSELFTASHLRFSVSPRVSHSLVRKTPRLQELVFKCSGVSNAYRHLNFDVVWEVEGKEVTRKTNLTYLSLPTVGSVTQQEWSVTGHRIGMHVRCGIRAYDAQSTTVFYYSDKFFAGFEFTPAHISVDSGRTATVAIRTTVPIACPVHARICQIYIEMFDLAEQMPSGRECNNNITKLNSHSHCGILFDGLRWSSYQSMVINTLSDQHYRSQYTAILKLRTLENDYDPLWDHYILPDIKVVVTDRSAFSKKGKVCKFITDPHLKRFDGTSYWGYLFAAVGEFILYKNKEKPYSVQTITSNRYDHGNCAVGIQAGADIFVIYGCEYPGKWIYKRYCNSETKQLDIYEKNKGREYEIHLPSGTYVTVGINSHYGSRVSHYLNVEVHISPSEWNKTEGLCGSFNGKPGDDRLDRSGNPISTVADFAKVWSIGHNMHNSASCSWRDGLPLCPPLSWNEQECTYRSKRDATGLDNDPVIDAPLDLVAYQPPPANVRINAWKNGWNRTSATEYCTRIVTGSSAFTACKQHTTVVESDSISICVSDIQVTGHTGFSSGAVESFMSACRNDIRLNASLWTSSRQGQLSPAEEVMALQCPNDCKQDELARGTCVQGNCQCFSGYAGFDCSVDVNASPILLPPTTSNLCDLSKSRCEGISLFGSNFNPNSNIKCRVQVVQTGEAESSSTMKESTTAAIVKSFGEVMCPFGNIRKRRSPGSSIPTYTKLLISVSNNPHNYSAPVPIAIYDSACIDCTMPAGRIVCKERDDICVTGGVCYSLSSGMCRNNKDQGDDKETNQTDDDKDSKLWIIGAVLGGLSLIAVIAVVLYKSCVKTKMSVQDEYMEKSYNDLHVYSNPPAATHYTK